MQPPRLADFALWVSAREEALGMKPVECMRPAGPTAPRHATSPSRFLAFGPLAELALEGFTGTVAELHTRL